MRSSRHLGPLALSGLKKAGDVWMPGGEGLPSFSESHLAHEVDRVLDHAPPSDLAGLRLLLGLFGLLPAFAVGAILALADRAMSWETAAAAPLRQLLIGVKGVAASLYYGNAGEDGLVFQAIGWDAHSGPRPEPRSAAARALATARSGCALLRKVPVRERLEHVHRLREVVRRRQEWIVDAVQAATGKSRTDALVSEVLAVLDHFDWLEDNAAKVLADRKVKTPLMLLGKRSHIWFEPLGTVLVISPWNYPFYQAVVPITSALACGNTVVYKPSEHTPLEGVVETVLREALVPPNWVQVVYGDGQVGEELIAQRPDKVFFTGSTRTGRRIMELAARHPIPVELELGGKDPMIVFADADLGRAAAGAVWGALTNAGQSCTSVERLLVQRPVFEAFRAELLAQVRRLRLGVDRDGSADVGHMTNDQQVQVVAAHLDEALEGGAQALTGASWDRTSRRIPPVVVDLATPAMRVWREETFGPLLPLLPFDTEEEAVALANDTEFGLSASVWSADAARAERVARRLVVGNVSVNNVMVTEGNHALPFGGARQSGFGRYKGELGLYAFSNVKSVMSEPASARREPHWYPYTPAKYALFQKLVDAAAARGVRGLLGLATTGTALEKLAEQEKHGRREGT